MARNVSIITNNWKRSAKSQLGSEKKNDVERRQKQIGGAAVGSGAASNNYVSFIARY